MLSDKFSLYLILFLLLSLRVFASESGIEDHSRKDSHKSKKQVVCDMKTIEFLRISKQKYPPGGYLYPPKDIQRILPQHCDHNASFCQFMLLRKYLPPVHSYLQSVSFGRYHKCDSLFSQLMTYWLTSTYRYANHTSLKYLEWSQKGSVGKYIRTAASLQYRQFQGLNDDYLINFYYDGPNAWPWADAVPECQGIHSNWNCAMLPYNQSSRPLTKKQWKQFETIVHPSEYSAESSSILPTTSIRHLSPTKITPGHQQLQTRQSIMTMRTKYPNSLVQLYFYAKHLQIIARPSQLVRDYLIQNALNIYPNNWHYSHGDTHSRDNIRRFSSYADFQAWINIPASPINAHTYKYSHTSNNNNSRNNNTNSHVAYLSLSMQVRQGDSCDYVLNQTIDRIHHLWSRVRFKRPCFAVNAYISELHKLASVYPIKRIFLATDSQEMIDRVYQEKEFNWILLNISRRHFGIEHGWIEKRNDADNQVTLFSGMADLLLMSFGDMFLGAMNSVFAKISYFVMVGASMRIMPFVSMDYPLMCETADACDFDRTFAEEMKEEMVSQEMKEAIGNNKTTSDNNSTDSTTTDMSRPGKKVKKPETLAEKLDRKATTLQEYTMENALSNPIHGWLTTNPILESWYCRLGQWYPPLWWAETQQCCVSSSNDYRDFNVTQYSPEIPLAARNCSKVSS